MRNYLDSLKQSGDCHLAQRMDGGFAVIRRSEAHTRAFNVLAREILSNSGDDYVALPRPDGPATYDQVLIIPLE